MQTFHRTLIRIDSVTKDIVTAFIPGWNAGKEAVSFSLLLIPDILRHHVKPNEYFMAQVNIGAEKMEDLRYSDFEYVDHFIAHIT